MEAIDSSSLLALGGGEDDKESSESTPKSSAGLFLADEAEALGALRLAEDVPGALLEEEAPLAPALVEGTGGAGGACGATSTGVAREDANWSNFSLKNENMAAQDVGASVGATGCRVGGPEAESTAEVLASGGAPGAPGASSRMAESNDETDMGDGGRSTSSGAPLSRPGEAPTEERLACWDDLLRLTRENAANSDLVRVWHSRQRSLSSQCISMQSGHRS